MDGGKSKTRAPSQAHRGRRRFRAAATPWFVAALAATLVGSGRVPDQAVLADGPGPSNTVDSLTAEQPVTAPPEVQIPGTRAVQAPASVSAPDSTAGGVAAAGIPDPALAAYQRAAVVIDTADLTCHLDWPLLAGIGQIESDHGQVGGSVLGSDGVSHPSILGPRLDGKHGTSLIRDTDAGRLDGDKTFDRAVGPMQFLPSTWAVVAVDGDDDGTRNVEDIDDAALGAAVYLCAGDGDLSTQAGAEAALFRYNHSKAYVAKVMSVVNALRLSSVLTPVGTAPSTTQIVSFPQLPATHGPAGGPGPTSHPTSHPTATVSPSGGPSPIGDPVPSGGPTSPPTTPPSGPTGGNPTGTPTGNPTGTPTGNPTGGGTPTGGTPTGGPTGNPTGNPTGTPTPTDPPIIPDPVPDALSSLTPAQVQAIDDGWVACTDTLAADWTFDQMQTCLAGELDVATDDPTLAVFLQWASDEGLVPASNETPTTP